MALFGAAGLSGCGPLAYDSSAGIERLSGREEMLTRKIGEGGRWLLEKIVDAVASTGINPNLLTFFGLLVNGWAAVLFADGEIPLRRPW